ncbi:MAG: DUF1194 domain-containing protein [Rhodospirillales bacterium]|nr:DUF1194 domain-containing protein [Rhodospirillales bacterium]
MLACVVVQTQFAPGAAAQTPVDLELVIAVDVSLSMDIDEQRLQRDGYVAAFRDSEIHKAITSGGHGRIAVVYMDGPARIAKRRRSLDRHRRTECGARVRGQTGSRADLTRAPDVDQCSVDVLAGIVCNKQRQGLATAHRRVGRWPQQCRGTGGAGSRRACRLRHRHQRTADHPAYGGYNRVRHQRSRSVLRQLRNRRRRSICGAGERTDGTRLRHSPQAPTRDIGSGDAGSNYARAERVASPRLRLPDRREAVAVVFRSHTKLIGPVAARGRNRDSAAKLEHSCSRGRLVNAALSTFTACYRRHVPVPRSHFPGSAGVARPVGLQQPPDLRR